jgi:hypothetical protein
MNQEHANISRLAKEHANVCTQKLDILEQLASFESSVLLSLFVHCRCVQLVYMHIDAASCHASLWAGLSTLQTG